MRNGPLTLLGLLPVRPLTLLELLEGLRAGLTGQELLQLKFNRLRDVVPLKESAGATGPRVSHAEGPVAQRGAPACHTEGPAAGTCMRVLRDSPSPAARSEEM
ncbi:unnamed protein product [Boreogadus saida]